MNGSVNSRRWALLASFFVGACSSTDASGGDDAGSNTDATATDGAPAPDAGARAPDAATDAASSTGACAALPTGAKLQGTGCTAASGTFSVVTIDTVANTYSQECGATPYKDQAEFDANEGTSTAAGVTITSHEDYVVMATCASGSIDYATSASSKTTIVFIWTKAP
jgi:hypothetical protein